MIGLPEYTQHEEYQNRKKKLKEIRELKVQPYPHKFTPSKSIEALREITESELGNSEDAQNDVTPSVSVAGRLVLFRAMGKNAFAQIQGETQKIQVMFNRDHTQVIGYDSENSPPPQPLSHIKFIEKKLDLGDIIGIEGNLFLTQKGELTVYAKKVVLLCKSLLPLPDKHSGLLDKEARYRKRWLDLIANNEVFSTFKIRSQIIRGIRLFCEEQYFLEVETPILQNIYGGANAKPFTTHLSALDDQQMFLRISLEISLKKLLVGGVERVFEIGKCFRNEGIDRSHNPEFTMLEAYAAYWDYNDMMKFVEDLYERIALKLFNSTEIIFKDPEADKEVTLNMKAPWERLTMKESLRRYANLDVDQKNEEELRKLLLATEGADSEKIRKATKGLLTFFLFEDLVEEKLIQPVHIVDHPIETTPLCKPHRNKKEREEGLVERFESFILGNEICNAYSELNDPIIQRELLEAQDRLRLEGDEEAQPLDEEFLESISQGMPPASGVGIGVDRMVMLFTNSHSIRDVLYFPLMKSKS